MSNEKNLKCVSDVDDKISETEEINLKKHHQYRSELDNIHNEIFDGSATCPPLKSLHDNLSKIKKYKINASTLKNFKKMLPSEQTKK